MSRLNVSVPTEQYLADSKVLFYLTDAVTQLLEHKEEYTQFGVIRYFAEYFSSVKNSNHVLFREFSYIRATPHNRASFIRVFWRCYRQIGKSGEFLDSVMAIYQDLLAGKSPNTVIVPTSASVEQLPSVASEENDKEEQRQDGVETFTLAQCIDALCDRTKHSVPPRSCMKEILEQTNKVSYYSFLLSLAKHEGINQIVGALPSKGELLIDPEMDQELDKLIAQISVSPGSNSSGSAVGALKEVQRKASPRRNIHHRRRMEVESDGSTEETDSSEN
ncbi:centriolar satellite-associated tubulin polyglutamylase complex regulator 1 isoform 3-T3 [Pholidichthys leucotaenia]